MTSRLFTKSCLRCKGDVEWLDGELDCLHCGWCGETRWVEATKEAPNHDYTVSLPLEFRIGVAKWHRAQGLTHRDIGRKMGVDLSTVQKYLSR